jgi:hypothetical protein
MLTYRHASSWIRSRWRRLMAYLLTDSHIGYRFTETGPVYGSAGLVADQCE